MSIEETTPSNPSSTEAGTAQPPAQNATSEAEAPTAVAPAEMPQAEAPKPSPDSLPLPEALQTIDDQIRAALIMVAHGNARLSKLAGNIRFSYLQRDESQLIAERKRLKTAFQQGESTELELKPALQALLQKTESQAGKLIAPPAKPSATEADPPSTPLPAERANQIRRALREAMMSLAAAAPLHLQIELAPGFTEAEPDIMAMAARIHALHRQVLGSLKAIRWASPTTCNLVFDNGKENKEVEAVFGEQGLAVLPDEYRQNQKPAPGARPAGQAKPQPRRAGGGKPAHAGGKPAQRSGANAAKAGAQPMGEGANAVNERNSAGQKARPHGSRPQGQGLNRSGRPDGKHPQSNRHPPRGPKPNGEQGVGTSAHKGQGAQGAQGGGQGRPHGKRPHGAQSASMDRRGEGQDQRGNRGQKSFPSNSAMADKLKAALGGLKLSGTKKG